MENALYGIFGNAVFVSEISLFRFLEVCQQLVRKYRTPALSIKYSICITYVAGAWKYYEVRDGAQARGEGANLPTAMVQFCAIIPAPFHLRAHF